MSTAFVVDGRAVSLDLTPGRVLADVLRNECGRTGVRIGCDQGVCGTCTVVVDGRLASSCSMLAEAADGCEVTTVQGLQSLSDGPSAVQRAFVAHGAFQCGACTPGMLLLAEALLDRHPDPSRAEIRNWMSANVCRCTGYRAIEDAVVAAAAIRRGEPLAERPWRPEEIAQVTGQPFYLSDTQLPGLLEARVLRSTLAHARIVSIDARAARALPGVVAVATGADVLRLANPTYGLWIKDQPVLATDRVRYVGDPVAAVAATDARTAARALALIAVEYEPLAEVASVEDAMAPGAPTLFDTPSRGSVPPHGIDVASAMEPAPNVLYEFRHRIGDVDGALAEADHVFTDEFHFSQMAHVHLEPLVTFARPLGEGVEVWSCNQDPFLLRQDIGAIFGLPEHLVRVHTRPIGGGFGAKSFCKTEPIAILLARLAAAPVRLSLSMDESFVTLCQHAAVLRLTTAVSSTGRLLARRSDILLDGGAYADASALVADKAGYRIGGPYAWPALDSRSRAIRTTKVPAGSFRGFGGTQASWASESQMDMIARRLGIDAVEFRRRNLLRAGQPFRRGDSAIDCDLAAGLDAVAARIGWRQPSATAAPYLKRGKGVAIGFKDAGGQARFAQARVKVTADGYAIVSCATVDMGQGATEAFRQIVARVLKMDPGRVARAEIDTDQTAFDQGTHASSATSVTGEAVRRAAEAVRRDILAFAAARLCREQDGLDLVEGSIKHGNDETSLRDLVVSYYGGLGAEFSGAGEVKVESDAAAALNAPIVFWMPNWCAAEVEVDTQTGAVAVLRVVTAADAGVALVPQAVRGQIEGACIQGLGQALFERMVFDGTRLVTATPQSYRVPVMSDTPASIEALVFEHGLGNGPFGAKGVGEAGILGIASAVANAIEDAVGVRLTSLPLSPDAVLAALRASGGDVQNRPPLRVS